MRVSVFSSKPHDHDSLTTAYKTIRNETSSASPSSSRLKLTFEFNDVRLTLQTAKLGQGCQVVSAFVNDDLSGPVLEELHKGGTRLIALRSAGFNHVDMPTATKLGMVVVRVPAYSPHSVAEHTVGLIQCANRKLHRAYNRVREHNFALSGLLGFDLVGKTVGVIGTGKIGAIFCRIMAAGFGCNVLAYDVIQNEEVKALPNTRYVDDVNEIYRSSHIISLHCPLMKETKHIINDEAIKQFRKGMMLVNTSRGGLVDTKAVLRGLKDGTIGNLALDVYEDEAGLFFEDKSDITLQDDVLARLLTFNNVVITSHQAFFTQEAVGQIASTTINNIYAFFEDRGTIYKV